MRHDLTHASWFSGVGGLDLGLERAGWRTVLHSEIDPYAIAVLARHWPGVPNLGDILAVPDDFQLPDATLWSGGFPCQDLSTANPTRRGLAAGATRSGLALRFLDLVERHRPRAVLLENVPGLLNSHGGRDFGTLLGRMGQLGYWWAYRVLDAANFDVPQRRRRVYVLALHARLGLGADRAAEVLSVGTRCGGHPATGHTPREDAPAAPVYGLDLAHAVTGSSWKRHDDDTDTLIVEGAPDHPDGSREAHGVARRVDGGGIMAYTKSHRATTDQDYESWVPGRVMPTLNVFDVGETRATALALEPVPPGHGRAQGWHTDPAGGANEPSPPAHLDGHRFRCVGNGVAAPVSYWIGARLRVALEEE